MVVLGEHYSVRSTPRHVTDLGQCHYKAQEIRLNPEQSLDCARDTLLHEVLHAIDHVDSLKLSEEQVRRVATGLRAVFTANPKFAKFVSE